MDAKLNHLTDNEKAEFSKLEAGKPGKDDNLEGFQRVSNTQYVPVAQGQYVVSDTRCPALHDCGLE